MSVYSVRLNWFPLNAISTEGGYLLASVSLPDFANSTVRFTKYNSRNWFSRIRWIYCKSLNSALRCGGSHWLIMHTLRHLIFWYRAINIHYPDVIYLLLSSGCVGCVNLYFRFLNQHGEVVGYVCALHPYNYLDIAYFCLLRWVAFGFLSFCGCVAHGFLYVVDSFSEDAEYPILSVSYSECVNLSALSVFSSIAFVLIARVG